MDIFSVLTIEDIMTAAVVAFIITWVIRNIIKIRSLINAFSSMSGPDGEKKELNVILEHCYSMFPLDKISFKGNEFKRGMKIKIVTLQNKIFTGEFIGGNNKNMLCIMTSKNIMAYDLTNISEITAIEN